MLRIQFKLTLVLLLSIGFSAIVKSQAVLFNQDFEDTASLFQEYVLSNLDKGIPADANWASLSDSSWVIRSIPGMNTHAAVATSNYDPAITANDWFITPAIRLGPSSRLSFNSKSLTAGKTDSFEVFVSTSEQSVNGCQLNEPVWHYTSSESSQFESRFLYLKEAGYSNQTVYLGFRLTTSSGGDKVAIDDIRITDDSISSLASLTFNVNMSKYIADSLFNPATDTVDVAGNFNDWDGTRNIMSLVPGSDSSIYTTTIPGFHDGDKLEFKFRINSSWNDSAAEFPYSAPNRIWTIVHDQYVYTAFYNEAGVISDIPEIKGNLEGVNLFPNPVHDILTIVSNSGVQLIRMVSLTGQVVREFRDTGRRLSFDISVLPSGTYFLLFYSKQGFAGSRKIIKS
jgi:hypothetical protein